MAKIPMQLFQSNFLKQLIMLDSESSVTLFTKRDYVENIHYVKEILELQTNGGPLIVNHKFTVPGFVLLPALPTPCILCSSLSIPN